jgi:hypothetical protein
MSVYSGKCDLADLVFGQGGYFDKDGKSVKFGDNVGAYYSDEWLDFLAFRKKTGGILYQHKNVKVDSYNAEEIKKHCKEFDYKKIKTQVPDKRSKVGYREITSYIYTYYGKEYTKKELNNKGGVYITVEIHFDTLLELLPYYPYLTSAVVSDGDKTTVYISDQSFVEQEFNSLVKHGLVSNSRNHYNQELAKHYAEVALRYYNPTGHEISEEVVFDSDGVGCTSKKINDRFNLNFDMDWLLNKNGHCSHWTSPKMIGENKIQISKQDLEGYVGAIAKIKYVEDFAVPTKLN